MVYTKTVVGVRGLPLRASGALGGHCALRPNGNAPHCPLVAPVGVCGGHGAWGSWGCDGGDGLGSNPGLVAGSYPKEPLIGAGL